MQKTKIHSDLNISSDNNEIELADDNANWKEVFWLEILISLCIVMLMAFIFFVIIYRLYYS